MRVRLRSLRRAQVIVLLLGSIANGSLAAPPAGPRLELQIAGIRLKDPASSRPILTGLQPKDVGLAVYRFTNESRTETITLFQHPGTVAYEVSQVSVGYEAGDNTLAVYPQRTDHFTTALGVHLGMAPDEVRAVLGKPTRESELGLEYQLEYIYRAEGEAELLRPYRMPEYFASYRFRLGRLVYFEFGFPYP